MADNFSTPESQAARLRLLYAPTKLAQRAQDAPKPGEPAVRIYERVPADNDSASSFFLVCQHRTAIEVACLEDAVRLACRPDEWCHRCLATGGDRPNMHRPPRFCHVDAASLFAEPSPPPAVAHKEESP